VSEFFYRATRDGRVLISREGREVATLRGAQAEKFRDAAERGDAEAAQLLMARATGNDKRGNERS
jgi:hypothetical protein